MGKDNKGKDLGPCLRQKKGSSLYYAHFKKGKVDKEKGFETLKEAKNWLKDMEADMRKGMLYLDGEQKVEDVFWAWFFDRRSNWEYNTARIHKERWERNIEPVLGRYKMNEVTSTHCQYVLNAMAPEIDNKGDGDDEDEEFVYSKSTIGQTRQTMESFFIWAYENNVIRKSPMISTVGIPKNGKESKKIDFFTLEEEKQFLMTAKDYGKYRQYRFILETGLRCSELTGLKWEYVNLKEGYIDIEKKLFIKEGNWCFGDPKTKNGIRRIFLTETALEILKDCKKNSNLRDDTPEEFRDLVFLGEKSGMPIKNSTYCEDLARVCKRAGVKKVSMHDLRHTFATRFVDSSSNYKVLSMMLGHSSIKITLDLYVHDDDDTKIKEVGEFSKYMREKVGF